MSVRVGLNLAKTNPCSFPIVDDHFLPIFKAKCDLTESIGSDGFLHTNQGSWLMNANPTKWSACFLAYQSLFVFALPHDVSRFTQTKQELMLLPHSIQDAIAGHLRVEQPLMFRLLRIGHIRPG